MSSFDDFKLLLSLQETLRDKGLVKPTEIQNLTLPELLDGFSVAGVAETGSGKTLAYVLPILHALKSGLNDKSSPEDIKNEFQISKKVFKQAIGRLYKQHKIKITDKGIELVK
jgi:superfamily II DNA/RNA helicase